MTLLEHNQLTQYDSVTGINNMKSNKAHLALNVSSKIWKKNYAVVI
jgi:hypothetical protein